MYPHCLWRFSVCLWYALLYVHSSFAVILTRKRKLVALFLLSFECLVTVNVLWLYLVVLLVGLRCVIVVIPDHNQLLFKGFVSKISHVLWRSCFLTDQIRFSFYL